MRAVTINSEFSLPRLKCLLECNTSQDNISDLNYAITNIFAGLVLSSKNARTLIIALGSALIGISIAFTISCICNMVLIRKHSCRKRKFTVESSEVCIRTLS